MTKFEPVAADLELVPLIDLLSKAKVGDEDREKASELWRDNPPEPEFNGLLDADVDTT